MKDRADFARKGIARGRSVVVLQYDDGIAVRRREPVARAAQGQRDLRPDRVRRGRQVQRVREPARWPASGYADLRGYSYDRARRHRPRPGQRLRPDPRHDLHHRAEALRGRDRRRRGRRRRPDDDQIYRLTYDGSVADEHGYVVMGGQAEPIATASRSATATGWPVRGAGARRRAARPRRRGTARRWPRAARGGGARPAAAAARVPAARGAALERLLRPDDPPPATCRRRRPAAGPRTTRCRATATSSRPRG